jgi:hypothetical protein
LAFSVDSKEFLKELVHLLSNFFSRQNFHLYF